MAGLFAAGDCTPFPVKHPSLAAQQADVVAAAIAADAGAPIAAEPFTPVLRGILPSRLRWYVEAPLTGGQGDATVGSPPSRCGRRSCASTRASWARSGGSITTRGRRGSGTRRAA